MGTSTGCEKGAVRMVGPLVVALVGIVGPVGCAGEAVAGAGPASVARPAELRLDGVDPCTLLTAAQVRQLGVVAGGRLENTDELGSVGCRWPNSRQSPSSGYVARLLMNRAADSALPGAIGAQVVTIDGFSAVRAAAPGVDPKNHCILVVDVAPGQSLWVQWLTISPNYPGLSHELACQQARDAARLMLSNLRGLSR